MFLLLSGAARGARVHRDRAVRGGAAAHQGAGPHHRVGRPVGLRVGHQPRARAARLHDVNAQVSAAREAKGGEAAEEEENEEEEAEEEKKKSNTIPVVGNLAAFVERLGDEYVKALQQIDSRHCSLKTHADRDGLHC